MFFLDITSFATLSTATLQGTQALELILVVVPMHSVSSDKEEIFDFVSEVPDDVEPIICPQICRIGLRHSNDRAV